MFWEIAWENASNPSSGLRESLSNAFKAFNRRQFYTRLEKSFTFTEMYVKSANLSNADKKQGDGRDDWASEMALNASLNEVIISNVWSSTWGIS